MKTFKDYLNEQQLDEANEITLYSVIKKDNVFKKAKDYMDKEGWNINKITLSKLLIDADPGKGKNLVQKYLNEQLNEATLTFDRVTPLDSKGHKAITYKDSEGRESYPVEFSPKMIDEKKLVAAVRKILG